MRYVVVKIFLTLSWQCRIDHAVHHSIWYRMYPKLRQNQALPLDVLLLLLRERSVFLPWLEGEREREDGGQECQGWLPGV